MKSLLNSGTWCWWTEEKSVIIIVNIFSRDESLKYLKKNICIYDILQRYLHSKKKHKEICHMSTFCSLLKTLLFFPLPHKIICWGNF